MSLGEYAPLSERKRPCIPRPALFALSGALLWAVVGLTATLATLSAAEVEVTAVEAIVPPGRCDHAQVALNVSYRLRRNMLAEKFRQGFFLPDPVAGAVLRVANASLDDAHGGALLRLAQPFETRLPAAGGEGSIVLRAGDFFGPRPGNNWFSQCLVQPGGPVRRMIHPGRPGIGHQWTYLPDMAATFLRLVAIRDRLPAFTTLHMAGHWDPDGTAMTAAIARAVGRPVRTIHLPWRLLGLAAPFVPLIRNLREMRHLWQIPIRMTNDRLRGLIGDEPHTPLDEAVRRTLTGLGCLPRAQTSQPGWR